MSDPATAPKPADSAPKTEPLAGASNGAGGSATPADRRAEQQALTGKAARMATLVSVSPGMLAWRRLKKNTLAVIGGWTLIVLYAMALFAPFIAPYDIETQDPNATFRAPMLIHFTPGPTVY